MTHRPHMPLSVKLHAAILQLGLDPACVDFDHDPALGLREFDETTQTYTPDANDPKFITVRARAEDHHAKTFGKGGTTAGSDIHRIAKSKRLAKAREALDGALQSKATGERILTRDKRGKQPFPKSGPMRSHGFAKRPPQNSATRPIEKRASP